MDHQLNNCFTDHVTHIVIEFMHEKTLNNKASIELVPRGWLDRVDEKWICYYPPKKYWPKVDRWTKTSKCRDRLWKGSEICILKEAANYEKGLRRLRKFFTEDVVLSTGEDVPEETDSQNNNIDIFTVTESQLELQNLPPMIPNDSVARASEDETIMQRLSRVEDRPTDPSDSTETGVRHENIQDNINNTEGIIAGAVGNSVGAIDLEKFLATVISQIHLSEKRILRELDGVKRSILYDAQVRADEVKNTVVLNSISSLGTDISQHMEHLGFELPFKTVENFEAFDAVVAADGEKRKSLESIMTKSTIGNKEFTAALSIILSSLLGKEVQLQYSACGPEIRGTKKKNFSETETFKCLNAVLTEKYAVSVKTIISKMSRWFIGAGDRAGVGNKGSNEED